MNYPHASQAGGDRPPKGTAYRNIGGESDQDLPRGALTLVRSIIGAIESAGIDDDAPVPGDVRTSLHKLVDAFCDRDDAHDSDDDEPPHVAGQPNGPNVGNRVTQESLRDFVSAARGYPVAMPAAVRGRRRASASAKAAKLTQATIAQARRAEVDVLEAGRAGGRRRAKPITQESAHEFAQRLQANR